MEINALALSRARQSRSAIEKLYIEMRHLFNLGMYRRLGMPGEVLTEAMLTLSPEIYGSVGNPNKAELDGLIYVIDRLPKGIEECRYIKLISEEGYSRSGFDVIVPAARRRNCYRIDKNLMVIEVTRGRSEIYDILTHLTFIFMEAEKIRQHAIDENGRVTREWEMLEEIVVGRKVLTDSSKERYFSYLSTLLGRSFSQTRQAYERMAQKAGSNNGLFHVVYWLGKNAMRSEEEVRSQVSFSPNLRDRIGHHMYGEQWADQIKAQLQDRNLTDRPLHIISANLHSVMNSLFARAAIGDAFEKEPSLHQLAVRLSLPENEDLRRRVAEYAEYRGMQVLHDNSGTNISVQIIDTALLDPGELPRDIRYDQSFIMDKKPVILVMDYAFGEQAFETMDELLKPFKGETTRPLNVASISIMGKAGILEGGKGDIMLPNAHIFEGTADNYPFHNEFVKEDFEGQELRISTGPMITVLGTSLQNRDVLSYFKNSSWGAVGLEMEGAHYQKAIQAAARVRNHLSPDITLRYAYYASDNPLLTGGTLASGSLGTGGVKPTYLITQRILEKIFNPVVEALEKTTEQPGTTGRSD